MGEDAAAERGPARSEQSRRRAGDARERAIEAGERAEALRAHREELAARGGADLESATAAAAAEEAARMRVSDAQRHAREALASAADAHDQAAQLFEGQAAEGGPGAEDQAAAARRHRDAAVADRERMDPDES